MPQSQTTANPRHQEEEKKDKNTRAKQTNKRTRSTKISSLFPRRGDQNAKNKRRNEDKEHAKTLKH